jgi:SOS regulatory protein LexA
MISLNHMPTKYLSDIIRFYKTKRRLPSYSEIMQITGLKSKNSIHKIIGKMVEEKFLGRDEEGKIYPGKRFLELPLLGSVAAGFPSPAEEELVDTISIDDYLINRKEATYLLKVQGDSMIDAGLMPGDLVLVERGREPKTGDIVVAEVDKQWTLKYFRKIGARVELVPANKKYKNIYPQDELKIAAIVVGSIRKYRR